MTLHESTAIIAVADDFTRNQIEGRLRTRLEDALGDAFDRQVRIAVTVDPELGGLTAPTARRRAAARTAAPGSTAEPSTRRTPGPRAGRRRPGRLVDESIYQFVDKSPGRADAGPVAADRPSPAPAA